MSSLDPRGLLAETPPIAAVLLVWQLIAWLAGHGILEQSLRTAGLVMALLYAVVRGVRLGREGAFEPPFDDLASFLRANGLVLLAAGAWFVAALIADIVLQFWWALPVPLPFGFPGDHVTFALAATGVVTAVLYAVAVGFPVVTGRGSRSAGADDTRRAVED